LSDTCEHHRLSKREREILDFATDGLTDQQIAYRLDISTSTVNSYWVRIRGKLGPYSRTELVASVLRQQADAEMAQLRAETNHLVQQAQQRTHDDKLVLGAELHRSILEALPEAMLAVDDQGDILFVNRPLEELFGYCAEELVGNSIEMLLAPRDRHQHLATILDYIENPKPLRLGIGNVIFGRHRDGRMVRIALALNGATTPRGPITVCIVRNFMEEIDAARQRATSSWEAAVKTFTR
jgi:PAS domain S-box-containing protein